MILKSLLSLAVTCALCFGFVASGNAGCDTNNGFIPYNSEEEICCNGMLQPREGDQECCGLAIISLVDQVCCNDQGWPRFVNSLVDGQEISRQERSCCGSELIITNESVCCFDTPVRLTHEQNNNRGNFQCCSPGVIADIRTKICCGGKVLQRKEGVGCCAGEQFYLQVHQCVHVMGKEVKIGADESICLNTPYKITEKSCCGGVINDTVPKMDPDDIMSPNPHFGCCEKTVMDPTKDRCCDADLHGFPSHIIPKNPDFECCGAGYYNKSNQACLDSKVVPMQPSQEKCGSTLIDTREEGCCANSLPYNVSSQSCCFGGQSSVIQAYEECCNGAPVGMNQLCCNDAMPCDKINPDDDDCCFNDITFKGQTFNSKRQYCLYGKVYSNSASICGNVEFDPNISFCCRGTTKSVLEDYSSGKNKCCGSSPYDDRQETCCYGRRFPVANALCCPFDLKAYKHHDPSSACTGMCPASTTRFDRIDETCCEGIVHRNKKGAICCGSSYFNPRTIDCCGDKALHSQKTSICQNGEVVPKRKNRTDTQGVCLRSMLMSVDGVTRHACTNKYALKGKLIRIKLYRQKIPDTAVLKLTLARVKALPNRPVFEHYAGLRRRLTIAVHVPMGRGIKCTRRIGKRSPHVAVFFDSKIKGRSVTINAQDSFRMVKTVIWRKVSINRGLCQQMYPWEFFRSNKPIGG